MANIDILSSLITNKQVEQEVLFAELQADSFDHTVLQQFPPISNIIINIVILKGTLQIVIDNIRHKCTPSNNNIVNIKPVNTITQMTRVTTLKDTSSSCPNHSWTEQITGSNRSPSGMSFPCVFNTRSQSPRPESKFWQTISVSSWKTRKPMKAR